MNVEIKSKLLLCSLVCSKIEYRFAKPVPGGVDSVASYLTVNKHSESNPDCEFPIFYCIFLLPRDHFIIVYLYLLKQALSPCVAAAKSRPILRPKCSYL